MLNIEDEFGVPFFVDILWPLSGSAEGPLNIFVKNKGTQ